MDDQAFELLMKRFDTIEDLLQKHDEKDTEYYKKVERHETFFKISAASLPPILGIILAKLGWK